MPILETEVRTENVFVMPEQVIPLLELAVMQRGTNHKAQAKYTYGGAAECITAVAMSLAGVSNAALTELDLDDARIGGVDARHVLLTHGVVLHPWAAQILQYAQVQQDRGHDWGTVLAETIAEMLHTV